MNCILYNTSHATSKIYFLILILICILLTKHHCTSISKFKLYNIKIKTHVVIVNYSLFHNPSDIYHNNGSDF